MTEDRAQDHRRRAADERQLICDVQGVSKRFDMRGKSLEILRGVDLQIRAGDLCSIVGQSGVGKSTLMHILGTLDRPASGKVSYFGEDVFALPEAELAAFRNRRLGFVFQFHHLLPELTAEENAALPLMIARTPRARALDRARALLTEVGLGARLHHRPGELSGGEQQRVAIARALIGEPSIVLADEPTGNLDVATSDEIHELILKMNERLGVSFVIVTHNPSLASMMTRRLVMRDGKVYE